MKQKNKKYKEELRRLNIKTISFVFVLALSLITLVHVVTALSYPVAVIPIDDSGLIQPNKSFLYTFNFTSDYACSDVFLSYSEVIITNSQGLKVININTTSLNGTPSFICEYRNGTLRKVHNISDQFSNNVYAFNGNFSNLYINGTSVNDIAFSTINLSVPNCTGDDVLTYNGTDLICISQTGGSGDNSSFNQSLTDTLYIPQSDEINLNVNSSNYWDSYDSANSTWFENLLGELSLKISQLTAWADNWLSGKTTDNLTQGTINLYDNKSWNQTLADTLYSPYGSVGNSSWNESYARTIFYDEETDLTTLLNDNYATIGYGDDWNKTYADTLYASISVTGDNSSFNQSFTDTLYAGKEWDYNQTTGAVNILNGTGLIKDWNSSGYITDWSSFDTDTNCSAEGSCNLIAYDSEINKTYVDTQDNAQDECSEISGCVVGAITDGNTGWDNLYGFWNNTFASFNKTYADTLYADISVTGGNSSWNESYADTKYLQDETEPLWSGNASSVLTDLTEGSNISISGSGNSRTIAVDVLGLKSYFDLVYATISTLSNYVEISELVNFVGNWSADKDNYYDKTTIESFNYYNSTNPQPDSNYTEDEIEAFIFDNDNTANLNMSFYNVTMSGGNLYSNSTCIKIKGATSLLEIC